MVIDNLKRIIAIERALRDVIVPAIDPKMGNAVEQAGYIIGHLNLLIAQNDWEYPFALGELRDFLGFTADLKAIAGEQAGAGAAISAAAPLAEVALPPLSDVKEHIHALREASDTLLRTALDGPVEVRAAASERAIAFARLREARDAAWLQGKGYGMPEGGVLPIAEALALA